MTIPRLQDLENFPRMRDVESAGVSSLIPRKNGDPRLSAGPVGSLIAASSHCSIHYVVPRSPVKESTSGQG